MEVVEMKAPIVLEPYNAIAFSERQWRSLLKLPTECSECWDPEYVATVRFGELKLLRYGACEYFMCVPIINAPYARIFVFGTYEVPDLIIDSERKAVIAALKRNRSFRKLLDEYRAGKLMWAYSGEFDDVRDERYPVFYVILNNSRSSIEIPVLSGKPKLGG
jgi:hypothetical protein